MEQKCFSKKPDVQLTLPLTIKQTKMSFSKMLIIIEKMSVSDEQIKSLMLETLVNKLLGLTSVPSEKDSIRYGLMQRRYMTT